MPADAAAAAQQGDSAVGQLPSPSRFPPQMMFLDDNVYPLPQRLNDALTIGKPLGEGGFGKVFMCAMRRPPDPSLPCSVGDAMDD